VYWGFAQREVLQHRERVEEIIDFLEIEAYRDHRVAELPYGIQKKVELGRALAMEPKLLLLDEPMAGMTMDEKADMARYILELREVHGLPMILIEHDMGVVMDLCDRILAMDYGRKIAEGAPQEIQNHPDVIRAYLGEEHGVAEEVAGGA
jgi:branched-chain amino acid transport system ATP-binding protein